MLKPLQKQSLSTQVFNQLRDEILNERYQPGDYLPSERELCDILHINRSSVREGLKRLEQAKLIEIRHGEGSLVMDFQAQAGIDLLPHLVLTRSRFNFIALRSLVEVRRLLTVEAARMAAIRIQEPEMAHILAIVAAMQKCPKDDADTFQDLDFQFHYTIARASENLALVFLLNSIRDIYATLREYFAIMFSRVMEDPSIYEWIADALQEHDADRARDLCAELIETGNRVFLDLYRIENAKAEEKGNT